MRKLELKLFPHLGVEAARERELADVAYHNRVVAAVAHKIWSEYLRGNWGRC